MYQKLIQVTISEILLDIYATISFFFNNFSKLRRYSFYHECFAILYVLPVDGFALFPVKLVFAFIWVDEEENTIFSATVLKRL